MKRYDYAHEGTNDDNFQRIKRTASAAADKAQRKVRNGERHAARKAGQGHRLAKRGDAQFG